MLNQIGEICKFHGGISEDYSGELSFCHEGKIVKDFSSDKNEFFVIYSTWSA